MTAPFLVNHLWQSSCFAIVAGLLAALLRRNSPKVRYWVWLSASLKFLLPFALLVSLGSVVPSRDPHPVSVPAPVVPHSVMQIAEPLTPPVRATAPAHAARDWRSVTLGIVWALGFLAAVLVRCRGWWTVRAVLRAATPIDLPIPVRALLISGTQEPGIVGFFRPVLILPAQLMERLNPIQLGAILTHELCHVRRRDNLFAAVHMGVEAIFWFHPLVWWIGSRMLEERELACDEEVLRTGCEPSDYVEGILKVCQLYVESPLPCVSGVTGADVKKRLRAILTGDIARELNGGKKLALAAIGVAAIAAPLVIGVVNAPAIRAQEAREAVPKFEVVSIKPCELPPQRPGDMYPPRGNSSPGRLATGCSPLLDEHGLGLIRGAYATSPFTPIDGAPSWVHSALYEINARAEGSPSVRMMRGPMMQALLEEYFHLKIHHQTIEGSVFFLTVTRGGPKLHPFKEGACIPYSYTKLTPLEPGQQYCLSNIRSLWPPAVEVQGATLDDFAIMLRPVLDRPTINKTGIAGRFDIHLEFSADGIRMPSEGSPAAASDGPPSIFTAVQETLGLKLEPGKGPIDTFVIEHIERPARNER
jgi:bla regulator protein BlaR1